MILHSFTHMTTETLRDVQMLLTFTLLLTWQGNAFRVVCFGILQKFSEAAFPIILLAGNVGWVFQTTLQPLGTISSTSDLYCCFFLQTMFVFLFPIPPLLVVRLSLEITLSLYIRVMYFLSSLHIPLYAQSLMLKQCPLPCSCCKTIQQITHNQTQCTK